MMPVSSDSVLEVLHYHFFLFSHSSLRKLLCLISDLQLKPCKMYSGDTYASFLSCFAQPYKISQIYRYFQNDNF